VPLKEFDHTNCKTEGWADQVLPVFLYSEYSFSF
jgi:hypothetical protein